VKLGLSEQTHEKRIAVFGGSFNPFHNGHLAVVRCLARRFDEVWVMPCNQHALGKKLAPAERRYAMCKLGIQGVKNARVSRLEIKRGGVSYTIDTLRELGRKYPHTRFYWAISEKSLGSFDNWRESETLKKHFNFLVVCRGKCNTPFGETLICDSPRISSSLVRERIARGESIKGLVSEHIEDYMLKHRLYSYSPQ